VRLIAANAASIRARHARREGEYTEAFDPRIVGLTGSLQQIAAVEQAVAPAVRSHKTRAGDEDDILDHGTYLCVMDPQGKFVRGLDFDTPSDRIADTLRAPHGAIWRMNEAWRELQRGRISRCNKGHCDGGFRLPTTGNGGIMTDPHWNSREANLLLSEHGICIQPINYPTVGRGTERLRITPTPCHEDIMIDMIDQLAAALIDVWNQLGLPRNNPAYAAE
jgi:hypothetical protein